MSNESCFRIVTRALTICALAWMVGNLLFLAPDVTAAMHYARLVRTAGNIGSGADAQVYLLRSYVQLTAVRSLLAVFDLMLALWLYRGAPGVRRFFGIDNEPTVCD